MTRLFIAIFAALILIACVPEKNQVGSAPTGSAQTAAPTPLPVPVGGNGNYEGNWVLPAVTTIYSMTVEVQAAPGQLSEYHERGTVSGSSYQGSGYVSGSWSGDTSGKGFLIIKVLQLDLFDSYRTIVKADESWTPLVKKNDVVVIKTEDSKMSILGAGRKVQVLCREDQEFVRAAAVNERPTSYNVTRELDNCRMLIPQLQ